MGIASHWQYLRLFWLSDHMRSLSWLLPCARQHENFHLPSWREASRSTLCPRWLLSTTGLWHTEVTFPRLTELWSHNYENIEAKGFAADWELTVCAYNMILSLKEAAGFPTFMRAEVVLNSRHGWLLRWEPQLLFWVHEFFTVLHFTDLLLKTALWRRFKCDRIFSQQFGIF